MALALNNPQRVDMPLNKENKPKASHSIFLSRQSSYFFHYIEVLAAREDIYSSPHSPRTNINISIPYFGSNISSTERVVNIRIGMALTAIIRFSIIWKSNKTKREKKPQENKSWKQHSTNNVSHVLLVLLGSC